MGPFSILVLFGLGLFALDRLARWMERRGWIYWRRRPISRRPISRRTLGSAFLTAHSFLEPGNRAILEAWRQEPDDSAESGDPPEPGGPERPDAHLDGQGRRRSAFGPRPDSAIRRPAAPPGPP